MDLSVFIPTYNEARIIRNTILSVYSALKELDYSFEIFVIDDGSTDNTKEIIKRLNIPSVNHIYYTNGPSRRENLADSFRRANSDIIMFTDSDLSVDLSYIPKLLLYTKEYDIVTGSRYIPNSSVKRSFYRKLVSGLYNVFMKSYFGSNIHDHQCGFKAFRKEALFALLNELGYDDSFRRGWFWDAELLIRAQKKGYSIKEFPISWKHGDKSTFSLKREIKMIPYVLRLRFRL